MVYSSLFFDLEDDAIDFLNQNPFACLMLVVAAGYLLGVPRWRGMSLGPAGGTLFVALFLGHFGLRLGGLYGEPKPAVTVGTFGFALFIYSVGFEAGAGFFATLRSTRGWRMVTVGVAVNVVAVLVAVVCGFWLELDASTTAGVLAGALTSAATLAAVSEVCPDPAALSVAFGLTFPFGLVGLVFLVQTLPRLMGNDLRRDADSQFVRAFPAGHR